MTFQEALERIRNPSPYLVGGDERVAAIAEQVEANRLAIEDTLNRLDWHKTAIENLQKVEPRLLELIKEVAQVVGMK